METDNTTVVNINSVSTQNNDATNRQVSRWRGYTVSCCSCCSTGFLSVLLTAIFCFVYGAGCKLNGDTPLCNRISRPGDIYGPMPVDPDLKSDAFLVVGGFLTLVAIILGINNCRTSAV